MTEFSPLPDGLQPETYAVRGGVLRTNYEETSEALFLNSGYTYESAEAAEAAFNGDIDRFVYSRYGNPTVAMFQERLRLLEGAEACFATASGMSAVFTALGALLKAGDRLVAARSLFGSCYVVCNEILPRWGIETVFVDGEDLAQWESALSEPTQAVFFETPANRCRAWSTCGLCRRSPTRPVPRWSSTRASRLWATRIRSAWVPT